MIQYSLASIGDGGSDPKTGCDSGGVLESTMSSDWLGRSDWFSCFGAVLHPRFPVAEIQTLNQGLGKLLDLTPILQSVVQIKVQVDEQQQAGKLERSYEYGTGFFVDQRGRILTSAHVLGAASDPRRLSVLYRGRQLQARLLSVDRKSDLAQLLVDAGRTTPLALAERKPVIGERVFAIGYPFVDVFRDSKPAVSVGHVAGTDRTIDYEGRKVTDLLLTDAFVADGCSGGPLIDEAGRVLGILRFNLSKQGTWLGLSFAQPISSYLQKRANRR